MAGWATVDGYLVPKSEDEPNNSHVAVFRWRPLAGASYPTSHHIIGLFCRSSREEPEPSKFLLKQHTERGGPQIYKSDLLEK